MQRKQTVASTSVELLPEFYRGGVDVAPLLNPHRLAVPVSKDVNDSNMLLSVVNVSVPTDMKGRCLNGLL